ncbi:PAS domain S-box protein [Nostocales cyanobacterium LEGE 12452]|nr:PAS domain S-box protein [Nostocales cyanobacterium LEGE 12452]
MTTVFFVEDSAEDRALYRRFLERDDRYTYDIYEFESGNKALQACQKKIPDVILLDYRLPDLDGLEFLTQLQRQTSNSQISVILLTGQGDETIAVQAIKSGAQDYLVKGKLTSDNLCRAVHGAIEQMQLMRQLKQQQEQQKLVGAIALNIRQSLRLQDILATSVQEVRQLLDADRVLLYQFTPQIRGNIVAESVLPQWTPIFGLEIEDTCFQENQREEYRRGKIWAATNIYEAGLSDCHIQLLEQFQVKANLVVPILLESKETQAVKLWGLFIAHQCSAPRQWQKFEVELIEQLTVQIAIAIQQAQLYHNLQILNTELEAKVEERTAKLQESDRRFCAIFNNTFQFTGLLTPKGILLEVNQTALSFGGLKLEDVINRPFWETHWWTISLQTQEELKQAIAHAAQGKFVRYEVDILGANNRVATIDFSLRPLQNETGKIVLLIPEGRDITEQQAALREHKQAEAALAKSEEQLRLTLEFNHIGLWDWNVQTGEVIWNDNHYRLLGLEPEISAASYQLWRDRVHPEDVDRIEQAVSNALTQHINFQGEYRVIFPDGRVHWLTGKGRGVYNEAGKPVRMLGVIIDISERKQAEAALQESEARFQVFMNNSPVLACITDTDGRVLYLNQTYLRTFKLLPEQVIGQYISDLYPDEIARQHFDNICTVIETNQVIEVIEFAPRPDGSLGEFLVYKFPILGLSAQKLVGRVAIDITERKILERELAHKQKLLDTFINNAPVGITILDRELRYSLINEALAEINGIPAAEHIGKTTWEIVPDIARKQDQIFRQVLTTGEPILDLEVRGETPKFPGVIQTWLASYFPIQSEVDEPISIGIVVVEISDRKRAEQMLELQAVIIRNMAEGICLIHATDGVFVYANPKFEQMFGYDAGELIGQHVSIVNYGDEHSTPEEINQVIKATVIQEGEATYEIHNVKKDGTPFWCSATASVFGHPEYGSVLVAIQQDITEQKLAEEKIKASLKEKEVLLKEIHHRVKNNLGIVSSLLQMQCRRTQDPVVTAILRDSQNRIASIALVHEKLYRSEDLADIDFAQYIPDLTTHLFDSYNVSSSQIQLHIQVNNASLDIETAIPCGLIINELVSNALKYAFVGNRGGKIEVKFYQQSASTLILIIRDNGVGLPENFDSKKTKTLGITLIQGLVKQLRGKLEIDSQQGTEFKITFTNSRT